MKFLDVIKSLFVKGGEKTVINTLSGQFGGKGVTKAAAKKMVQYGKRNVQQNNASLASVSSLSVLDPVGIYDASLKRYQGMDMIMQMALIIIMGYVLRAVPFLAGRTRNSVIQVLSQLSPGDSLAHTMEKIDAIDGIDAYEFGLPTTEARTKVSKTNRSAYGINKGNQNTSKKSSNKSRRARLTGRVSGLQDANDFSIGKSFEIDIPIGRKDVQKISLTMILQARAASYETLIGIGDGGSPSREWLERWMKFQAGSKSMTEIVTQGDLVAKDVKAAMADKSGVHAEIMRRKASGKVATTFGGKVRYGIGSNLLITSLDTTERMMRDLRFDISDYNQRQKIMGAFSCLLWIVVDKEEDFLINYYRDIRLASDVSLATVMRLVKKGGGADQIVESLRALSANRAPVI